MVTKSSSPPIIRNVKDVVELEERWRAEHGTPLHALGEVVLHWVGSPAWLGLQIAFLLTWLVFNGRAQHPFDPYPFSLLGLILAMEAIVLSTFVLIVQQQMNRAQERRDHLNLQLTIVNEQEATKSLELLQRMALHLGLEQPDAEVSHLIQKTDLESVAMHLEDHLPE
ncbi:MAG TPA: DUF1003 domain-containing protein [Candidatus Xenobia bacterium]